MSDIGEPYISYLKWLLDLCIDISFNQKINKMSSKAMAIVISPNLFDPTKIENPMKAMTISAAIVKFLELSIKWRQSQYK